MKFLGRAAGGRLAKAEGRMPQPGDFAVEVRPQRSERRLVRVGGMGGREGATEQLKRIFGHEIHSKHDLSHDMESINQKIQLKS